MAFWAKTNFLADQQNGFRKNRSCLHHIFVLSTLVKNKCKVGKGQIITCFIDFRKAFDFVDRDLMICTLSSSGVTGTVLELIKQMYTRTSNTVRIK